MPDADRLPEIQDRAAKARAGSHDVDWLIAEVVHLRAEADTLGTEKGVLEERFAELVAELDKLRATHALAASLTERLAALQDGNEGAYRELYDAMNGPHLCPGQPFGHTAAAAQGVTS